MVSQGTVLCLIPASVCSGPLISTVSWNLARGTIQDPSLLAGTPGESLCFYKQHVNMHCILILAEPSHDDLCIAVDMHEQTQHQPNYMTAHIYPME